MGTNDDVEACGRCAMSSAIESGADGEGTDPFGGDRIEVEEEQLRNASRHVVALGKVKSRLNEWATKLTYGDI